MLVACVFLFFCRTLPAQDLFPVLSGKARVSVLTCGPGQELYEAFGHSAVRIQDPALGLDLVFNYGMFSFNQENFYVNFARGYMKYTLGYTYFNDFVNEYRLAGRSVREQVLNLDSAGRQSVLAFLAHNLQPGNREYYYHYFRQNCSTKIIDLLDSALNHRVVWRQAEWMGSTSYRARIHDYTIHQPWGRLGIDLGLGPAIDRPITPPDLNFLPEEVEKNLSRAGLLLGGGIEVPLVSESRVLHETRVFWGGHRFGPGYIFSLLFFAALFAFFRTGVFPAILRALEKMVFSLSALTGMVMLSVWLFTNHVDSAWNLNLLWANPLWFALVFAPGKLSRRFPAIRRFLFFYFMGLCGLWYFLPQELNPELIPLVLSQALLVTGSFRISLRQAEADPAPHPPS